MPRLVAWASILAMLAGLTAPAARADTLRPARAKDVRKLDVLREYTIPVTKGAKTTAEIPAMMSFWGTTNQQVILDSEFTYSQKPDDIKVIFTNRGAPRRSYSLTWDSPAADTISVKQKLRVELTCSATLFTAAKLPYAPDVLERFKASLGKDEDVNPDHDKVQAIAKEILGKTKSAEEAVELACDWVQENIPFQLGSPGETDTVLANGKASCTGMSNVVCAILRRAGIPAEGVHAKFIGGTGGHMLLEAYFPDAGWVFYDPSNGNRGFKSLDCLTAIGEHFWVSGPPGGKWQSGYFCVAKDASPYTEDDRLNGPPLRAGPKQHKVAGATVVARAPAETAPVRHQSLRELLEDLSVPPGKRDYAKESGPQSTTKPAVAASGAAPADPAPVPSGLEQEAQGKLRLAKTYIANGMAPKAREILQGIIKDYPQTAAAKDAQAQLKKLP